MCVRSMLQATQGPSRLRTTAAISQPAKSLTSACSFFLSSSSTSRIEMQVLQAPAALEHLQQGAQRA